MRPTLALALLPLTAAATSIVAPASHTQTESTVGFSYVFAEEEIRQEIAEQLDALDAGLAEAVGDLAGSGSDTIRVTRVGGIGLAERFTAMSTETEAIPASGYTLGLDTVTIGRYGLAKEQTFQDQGLQRPGGSIGLDRLMSEVPRSWVATLRYLVATAAGTFASGSGTSGVAWSLDDELELIAAFHETAGYDPSNPAMIPRTMRAPICYTQLRNSLRNEPGYQSDAAMMSALLGLNNGKTPGGAFPFLGLVNFASNDVVTSGSDRIGGAWVPGAIAWATMSTSSIRTVNPAATMMIPQYGILIVEETVAGIATGRFAANAWVGVDLVDATLAPQFTITHSAS